MKNLKKWFIRYAKINTILFVIYVPVVFLGDWIITKRPLKDKEKQSLAELAFAVMKYCIFSPVFLIERLINKLKKDKVAE